MVRCDRLLKRNGRKWIPETSPEGGKAASGHEAGITGKTGWRMRVYLSTIVSPATKPKGLGIRHMVTIQCLMRDWKWEKGCGIIGPPLYFWRHDVLPWHCQGRLKIGSYLPLPELVLKLLLLCSHWWEWEKFGLRGPQLFLELLCAVPVINDIRIE